MCGRGARDARGERGRQRGRARARPREKNVRSRRGTSTERGACALSDASSRPAWPFRRETPKSPRARGVGSGRARTSFSAKSSMSMITSRLCAVRPAILDAASPSTMIVGESTAVDLGVHSLEDAREDLAPALALFGARRTRTRRSWRRKKPSSVRVKKSGRRRVRFDMRASAGARETRRTGIWFGDVTVSRAVERKLES